MILSTHSIHFIVAFGLFRGFCYRISPALNLRVCFFQSDLVRLLFLFANSFPVESWCLVFRSFCSLCTNDFFLAASSTFAVVLQPCQTITTKIPCNSLTWPEAQLEFACYPCACTGFLFGGGLKMKLVVGVGGVTVCLSLCHPCNKPLICPGCAPILDPWQLG